MDTFVESIKESILKNPFLTMGVLTTVIILLGSLQYISYINNDTIFKNQYSGLNFILPVITKFFITKIVILCMFLVTLERKDIFWVNNEDSKAILSNYSVFLDSPYVKLIIIFNVVKTLMKLFLKVLNFRTVGKDDIVMPEKYHFLAYAFIIFILIGYFTMYNDEPNIPIILIAINSMNIAIGVHQLIEKKNSIDSQYFSECIVYLYAIISLII